MSDTIDRQAAMDEWKNDFKGYVNALNIPKDDYNGIMEYIDELPPAEPERKTGKWNWVGFNIECSECGFMPNFDSTEPLYNFCPNCGAKMERAGSEDIPMEYFESGGR